MPDSVSKTAAPVADYDGFAAAYSASNENNLFNAYYARPEMIRLAGDVAGLEILDAGCGSGPLMEALRGKDAVVSGFDLSPAMVELARQRLGEDADVRVADLGAPLPYPDDTFDLVVASLSLHYVKDYDFGEGTVWMTYWHRPLQDVINTFITARFGIKTVTEPPPAANTPAELLPNADGRSFICFLFFELEAR